MTRLLSRPEIENGYEQNTGAIIIERFKGVNPLEMRAVLVAGHAPFCWGATPSEAAHLAWMLEEIGHMAYMTLTIESSAQGLDAALRDKHFLRKHGPEAYYGQNKKKK